MSAFLWLLDNRICPLLTLARTRLQSSAIGGSAGFAFVAALVSPLTQLHGWWHVLAAVAANFQTNYVAFHKNKITGAGDELEQSMFGLKVVTIEGGGKERKNGTTAATVDSSSGARRKKKQN